MKLHSKITAKVGCYLQIEHLFLDVTYTDIEDLNKFMDSFTYESAIEITQSWIGCNGFGTDWEDEDYLSHDEYEQDIVENAAQYSWRLFEAEDVRYTTDGVINWDVVDLT